MVSLEAIDMSKSEEEIVPQLMNNLRNVGFLTLKNVPGYDEGRHFQAVRAFYTDIPESEKKQMIMKNHCPENKNIFRGLSPVVGNDAAHKEMYDMGGSLNKVSNSHLKYGLYEETPFPQKKKYQWIQK